MNSKRTKLKFILLTLIVVINFSCSGQEKLVTKHKDAWIQNSDGTLFYCKANSKTDSSFADPTCFEAGYKIFSDQKKQ